MGAKVGAEWRGVLASRYRARLEPVDHLVVLGPFTVGRMRRAEGDTLCRRIHSDNMADIGGGPERCERCVELATKLGELLQVVDP